MTAQRSLIQSMPMLEASSFFEPTGLLKDQCLIVSSELYKKMLITSFCDAMLRVEIPCIQI